MNVKSFLQAHQVDDERYRRFNEFDPDRFDYTIQYKTTSGDVVTIRNPGEAKDGTLADKSHSIPADAKLVTMGTAFWEWTENLQHTVGIDIDTNDTHANGLESASFDAALAAAKRVPWLVIRRSSGGKGIHAFPEFSRPVRVSSRKEAAALARAVLTLASREAGFDFQSVKDCAGSNFWIRKADAAPNAYEVIKEATGELDPDQLPPGWREAEEAKTHKITIAPSTVVLSPEHLQIEKQLQTIGYSIIYVSDLGCYQIHTRGLQEAYEKFDYRGYFTTVSDGTDPGKPNGYMFPLPGGGFLVKRFGEAKEDASWYQGGNGQYALLNTEIPFEKAVQQFAENSTEKGYAFDRQKLVTLLKAIGVTLDVPDVFASRKFFLKASKKDVRITVAKQEGDVGIEGWTPTKDNWERSFPFPAKPEAFAHAEAVRASNVVRAVSTDTESAKWCVKNGGEWIGTKASEVKNVLTAYCNWPEYTMGRMRENPYRIVFEPFRGEYLPGRRWNHDAPQYACQPANVPGDTPTWDAVFNHIGSGLDEDIANDETCQRLGIVSGAQYLKLWTKLLIERPQQRTPYLFLTSRQNNTGKTSLGASICHLIDPGVAEINEEALVDKFTGELEGKVLCLIEELDLRDRRNKAYSTLKRVLTSKTLTIRKMRTDAYNVPNFTHFIHTANDANFVPCETEDMRIVMISVRPITEFIESLVFEEGIKREAPSILRKLIDMPLPEPCGRFYLPVVQTSLKESVLTGLYDDEVSEAEEGVKKFASKFLTASKTDCVPTSLLLEKYVEHCKAEKLPQVAKMGFLKTLREKAGLAIDKKQKRIDGKQLWHYTGIALKA
jgi:hypothetical protein